MAEYAFSRSLRLESEGFCPSKEWKGRTAVSVAENGKCYKVSMGCDIMSAVSQVDGDIIRKNQKCDKFLVAVSKDAPEKKGLAIFIELKGKDISHAIDQLEATIRNYHFLPYPKPEDGVRARIVTANCGPKSSSRSKLEQARVRFKRNYNIDLRVLKNGQPDQVIDF